ncbi:hypothetical protein [Clostridium liquoris]|uniref:hypothetical protein n=1 Tax=Clostridium liquoris TaxID=1289519 RepID=UPI001473937C|nr:hypothetical protein [Clostridium liquoris]
MASYGVACRQVAISPPLIEVGVSLPRLDEYREHNNTSDNYFNNNIWHVERC